MITLIWGQLGTIVTIWDNAQQVLFSPLSYSVISPCIRIMSSTLFHVIAIGSVYYGSLARLLKWRNILTSSYQWAKKLPL